MLSGTQIGADVYDQYYRIVIGKLYKPQKKKRFEEIVISKCSEETQAQWELFKKKLCSDYTKNRIIRLIRYTKLPEKAQDRMVDAIKEKYKSKTENNKNCNRAVSEYLTWLEHRRWNAYLRSIGFASNDSLTNKDMMLKLHNCLVESGHKPFCKEWYAENGKSGNCAKCPFAVGCLYYNPTAKTVKKVPDDDWLDIVGFESNSDYKIYDCPDGMDADLSKNIEAVNKILSRQKS